MQTITAPTVADALVALAAAIPVGQSARGIVVSRTSTSDIRLDFCLEPISPVVVAPEPASSEN